MTGRNSVAWGEAEMVAPALATAATLSTAGIRKDNMRLLLPTEWLPDVTALFGYDVIRSDDVLVPQLAVEPDLA